MEDDDDSYHLYSNYYMPDNVLKFFTTNASPNSYKNCTYDASTIIIPISQIRKWGTETHTEADIAGTV